MIHYTYGSLTVISITLKTKTQDHQSHATGFFLVRSHLDLKKKPKKKQQKNNAKGLCENYVQSNYFHVNVTHASRALHGAARTRGAHAASTGRLSG